MVANFYTFVLIRVLMFTFLWVMKSIFRRMVYFLKVGFVLYDNLGQTSCGISV